MFSRIDCDKTKINSYFEDSDDIWVILHRRSTSAFSKITSSSTAHTTGTVPSLCIPFCIFQVHYLSEHFFLHWCLIREAVTTVANPAKR